MKKIALLLFYCASFYGFSQETLLRLNYKKGETYKITIERKSDFDDGMFSNKKYDFLSKVIQVTDKSIEFENKLERARVNIGSKDYKISYDSNSIENESNSNDEFYQYRERLKDEHESMLKVSSHVERKRYGNLKPDILAFSDLSKIREIWLNFKYPEDFVKVGSEWKSQFRDSPGTELSITYKVVKLTSTTVFLEIKGTISTLDQGNVLGKAEIDILSGNINSFNVKLYTTAKGKKLSIESIVTSVKI